jgi:hypothetical protein
VANRCEIMATALLSAESEWEALVPTSHVLDNKLSAEPQGTP